MQSQMDILAHLQAKSIKQCSRTYICMAVRNPKIIRDPFSRISFHTTFPSLYLYQPLIISLFSANFSGIFGVGWAHLKA